MRAREPDESGTVDRGGVRIAWERHGDGDRTLLFVPTWHLVHSRVSKFQVATFARRFPVITFDPRGNGRSDRPASGYRIEDFRDDALAVLDAARAGTGPVDILTASQGSNVALLIAAEHPELVARVLLVGPAVGHDERLDRDFVLGHYDQFLKGFFRTCFYEPHSLKAIEDTVGWGRETTPEVIVAGWDEYDSSTWFRCSTASAAPC